MEIINCDDKRKIDLIELSYDYAVKCLEKFFKNINLDYNLYSGIFDKDNLKLKIYSKIDDIDAQFDSKSNTLYLNEFYLIDLLDLIDDDRNNTNKAFKNLSRTFVHEMIHAIRTININKKRNISRYDAMLDSILEKYDVSSLRPYIPVYSKQSKDGTFIVAYDREKKEYEEFYMKKIDLGEIKDNYDYILKLGQALNWKSINLKFNKENSEEKDDSFYLRSSLISDYYDILNGNKTFNSVPISRRAYGLEESVTDVLASLIIMLYNKDDFNINKCLFTIYKYSDDYIDKIASYLIMKLGVEYIEDFFLPIEPDRKSIYDDKLRDIFGKEYEYILSKFNKIYNENSRKDFFDAKRNINNNIKK